MGLSAEEEAAEAAGRRRRGEEQLVVAWLDVEPAPALATSVQAVMAPALTEAGPQKPENLIPALPKAGFLSAEQAKQVCQNREVLAQFVVSANVQPTTIDEQCLQGIPKDLLNDVIKLKFGSGFEGLSELIGVAASVQQQQPSRLKPAVSTAIMSSSEQPSSMAEPADSMCFFNQNIMGPSQVTDNDGGGDIDHVDLQQVAKSIDDHDDKQQQQQQLEVERSLEQIMGFASDINVQPGDVIGQNVEDILQVIKSMESAAETGESIVSDHRLSGGCGGLVEGGGSSQSAVEGVSEMFPDGEAFALNLLNDMDVMNLVNDNIADSVVAEHQPSSQQQQLQQAPTKYTELAQQQAQVERRQHELERRASFLSRRLRKLQSQLVGEHVAEEANHVLELAQKSAKKCFYQDLASLGPKAGNTRNFPELAGSLGSFLQKVQKSCNAQSNSIAVRQRNTCRYFGAGSKDNYVNPTANRIPVFGVPQIKIDGEQVEKVAGPLATKLKILQSAYDSDCTASSSGGESCDEMQTFNNLHQQSLPIAKRAGWRYAQDRASVASRWTWLQAQISDLEYKIRQHNELQRQIRASKGLIILEASPPPNATAADSSTVNGYSGALPGSRASSANCATMSPDASPVNYGASRTRPFVRHLYRKRKLVQLDGLHEVSKKAARPATTRCSCEPTMAPCAVCTGRKEPTASQTNVDLLSVQERIAMVDPGFHPVLSLPDEVPHTVHIDAIMRSPEWQQKMLRGGMRMAKIKDKDSNERRNKKVAEQRVKYPAASTKKSQAISMGARIKRRALKGKRSQSTSERTNHGLSSGGSGSSRKRSTGGSKVPTAHQQQQQQSTAQPAVDDEEEASALSGSSKYSSPVPSPLLPNQVTQAPEKNVLKERSNSHSHSRIRQNSYDIDNIVIPYSVAASARLEKLPYKEILIPKWRLCDDPLNADVKNGAVQKPGLDNDFEDISDETTALRHERGGIEEAKRYEKNSKLLPHHSRIRHSRRTDSRTDSGANTPDPMSPHASDFGGDTMSPITSPPATPSTPQDHEHPEFHHRPSSLQIALRRRTTSSSASRLQREESNTSITEEHEQVLPYEPRSFPLTDEDYSKMVEAMPSGYLLPPTAPSVCSQEEEKVDEPDVDSQSDSTESAMCDMEGEDPNDPEWTVAESRDTEKERIRPTAKR